MFLSQSLGAVVVLDAVFLCFRAILRVFSASLKGSQMTFPVILVLDGLCLSAYFFSCFGETQAEPKKKEEKGKQRQSDVCAEHVYV